MNRYKLSKAGVRANEGIARFGGNAEAYEELLMKFPRDESYTGLCEAMDRRDAQAAFSYAHALKGLAGNMSMTRLYEDMLPLVEALRHGNMDDALPLLPPVQRDYAEVIAAI